MLDHSKISHSVDSIIIDGDDEFMLKVNGIVCLYFGVDPDKTYEKGRWAKISQCRQISAYIIHKMRPLIKSKKYGAMFHADRTNMYHYINIVKTLMETETNYNHMVNRIIGIVKKEYL